MLKIVRIVSGVIAFALAGYSLISKNFEFMSSVMLFCGVFMLATGLVELQKDRKKFEGSMFFIVSLILFFVSIQGFLLN